MDGSIRRYNAGMGMGMGMGNFGGAFLLINALSSKIYELIADSTSTLVRGYEKGGLIGLIKSSELRALLRRYLWLITIAFAFERARSLWNFVNVFGSATKYLYIDATLKPGDQAYEWILAFWEHSSAFKGRSRQFVIETGPKSRSKRAGFDRGMHHMQSIYDDPSPSTSAKTADGELQTKISPNDNADEWIWHQGTLFQFKRRFQPARGDQYGGYPETSNISIRSYSLSRKPLFKLLEQAKVVYDKTKPEMITLRVLDQRGAWRKVAYRHRRPLTSIIMDGEKRMELLADAKEFLQSESWYNQRGLPWKRGYMLYGSPGTGKSSTIQALASEIKLDVYIISLNSGAMNDSVLGAAMRSIPPRSLVCMEDVDVAFSSQKRELENNAAAQQQPKMRSIGQTGMFAMAYGGNGGTVSLSAALNAIDGVEANEGRLLFLTTNALHDLDPALIRPGRVDLFVHYKKATVAQAEELFNVFYTPAKKEGEDDKDDLATEGSINEKQPLHPFELSADITQWDIQDWARDWSQCLSDGAFTIAELQGMLLGYKKDPKAAVEAMPAWVKKESKAKEVAEQEKAEKEKEKASKEKKQKKEGATSPRSAGKDKDLSMDVGEDAPPAGEDAKKHRRRSGLRSIDGLAQLMQERRSSISGSNKSEEEKEQDQDKRKGQASATEGDAKADKTAMTLNGNGSVSPTSPSGSMEVIPLNDAQKST